MKQEIFFDNNGTTPMDPDSIKVMTTHLQNARNPSSASKNSLKYREMLKEAKSRIETHCGSTRADPYTAVFTSGASESNCFIIKSTVLAYRRIMRVKPVVITSAIEHWSIMSCCKSIVEDDLAEVVYVMPNCEGSIPVHMVERAIRANTNICLISIMFGNNEIGTINNVREIGALAHANKIPFHVDAVQGFGKYHINMHDNNIDALSASFHKVYGPVGLGVIVIRNDLISGYRLDALISGTQQDHLRGGTENVSAIAASMTALDHAFTNRGAKNNHLAGLRAYLIQGLAKIYPLGSYMDHVRRNSRTSIDSFAIEFDPAGSGGEGIVGPTVDYIEPVEIIILGPTDNETARVLPNTVLFSIVKNVSDKYGDFCNVKLRKDLDDRKIVVSIGSNCNTDSPDASHVLRAIQAPPEIIRGVIRVSFGDQNTKSEIDQFLTLLKECCDRQIVKPRVRISDKPPVKIPAAKSAKSATAGSSAGKQTKKTTGK